LLRAARACIIKAEFLLLFTGTLTASYRLALRFCVVILSSFYFYQYVFQVPI
jgi:hypothetical protein